MSGARRVTGRAGGPQPADRAVIGVSLALIAAWACTGGGGSATGERVVTSDQVRLRIDPNVATREELMLLPRIGPALADYIVEYRESVRPARAFRCPEDLERVERIGPKTVEVLRPYLCFPPAEADDAQRGR